MSDDVFIVAALRSPIGRLSGSLSGLAGHDLGAQVISALLDQVTVQPSGSRGELRMDVIGRLEEVVVGQVFTAAAGQNPARRAAVGAGIPYTVPAYGVNMLCGSGLKAVCLAYDHLRLSADPDRGWSVAGGQESMSQAVHATPAGCSLRSAGGGQNSAGLPNLGNFQLVDTIVHDGLTDAFCGCSMGQTCEVVSKKFAITRESQDAYAVQSQARYSAALKDGLWANELTPIEVSCTRKGRHGEAMGTTKVATDEHPRPDSSPAGLSRLKPVFAGVNGTVTAGNTSGVNDGAAFLLLCRGDRMLPGLSAAPMARIVGWHQVGTSPELMSLAPCDAVRGLLRKLNWPLDSVAAFEINEAFAAQTLAVIQELGLPASRVNAYGGAIALGHPLGCSGARILVTLVNRLCRLSSGSAEVFHYDNRPVRGVASLCIGGGMGLAIAIETCPASATAP